MGCCQSQNQILDKTIEEKINGKKYFFIQIKHQNIQLLIYFLLIFINLQYIYIQQKEVQTTQIEIDKQSQLKYEKSAQSTSCKNIKNNNIVNDQSTLKTISKNNDYNYPDNITIQQRSAQDILNQYQIGKIIGESKTNNKNFINKQIGLIGCTCLATHKKTGQIRVLKVVPVKKIKGKENQQLSKELQLLKQIDHPYIVKVFEHFQDEKYRYIITEYCQGQELLDTIKNLQPLNEKIASKYMKQILSAIVYCHIFNIVHKHMKPENILFFTKQNNSILKLIDFSKEIESKQEIVSPPYYTPPETITENKYDEKSDVWSIGIIMYILLNGQPPFYGNSDQKVFEKIKIGKFDINENISQEAKELINSMLQVDPQKRISASEACAHPWIINNFNVEPLDNKIKEKLVLFTTKNKFRNAVAVLLNNIPIFINDIDQLKQYFDNNFGLINKQKIIQGIFF
ncbi:protein kinase domain protein [Ichthyophthirius multifiliis]|uniref:Protein kinase domain protein n=1 Tax=Ichthyophthirius multifiliis TaxID=5932 RepID=G0QXD7_ICHMU|nr:protein kinase domain protein [Ichthyophthirius multifiliis]EGR30117.1 protein kinase domain protein [Ichthyophthirius multifiliis]|eukprot:XP_004031353.1 protein kinase domain protein [Ichthyophthirius multifiliis]